MKLSILLNMMFHAPMGRFQLELNRNSFLPPPSSHSIVVFPSGRPFVVITTCSTDLFGRLIFFCFLSLTVNLNQLLSENKLSQFKFNLQFLCLEEFTIQISRENFEPEPGFESRISRSLAWRSYQQLNWQERQASDMEIRGSNPG